MLPNKQSNLRQQKPFLLLIFLLTTSRYITSIHDSKKNVQLEQITCEAKYSNEPYKAGDKLVVCINFFPTFIKQRVILNVGQNDTVHAKYFWRIFEEAEVDVIMQVVNSKNYTMLRPYNRPKQDYCFPFMTVVISMNLGRIIDISFRENVDVCADTAVETKILNKLIKNSKGLFFCIKIENLFLTPNPKL